MTYTDLGYDWEFLDDGTTIMPISIGLARENGTPYYAVNRDMDQAAVMGHEFLRKNVVPYLPRIPDLQVNQFDPHNWLDVKHPDVIPLEQIAHEVSDLITTTENPRLVGYFPAYDHVCLMQLWGPMAGTPHGVPWRSWDIAQQAEELGMSTKDLPKQPTTQHHALNDAIWTLATKQWLDDLKLLKMVDLKERLRLEILADLAKVPA